MVRLIMKKWTIAVNGHKICQYQDLLDLQKIGI